MQISKISHNKFKKIGIIATDNDVDIIYLADSFGSLVPDDIVDIVRFLKESWDGQIGFHAHDNKGFALVNKNFYALTHDLI